ncbi:hypothetical protein L208DRAFT_548631 [Tricholoma matsutake]|nr:hypothetical protein L208DRAFT_548631 [Tricholoma matsutake 945]
MKTSLPFVLQLRCACEIIFDVMLSAYIAGLTAYYDRSEDKGKKQGSKRPSLDGCFNRLNVRWQHLGRLRISARAGILILRIRSLMKHFLHYRRGINSTRLHVCQTFLTLSQYRGSADCIHI